MNQPLFPRYSVSLNNLFSNWEKERNVQEVTPHHILLLLYAKFHEDCSKIFFSYCPAPLCHAFTHVKELTLCPLVPIYAPLRENDL